MAEALAETRLDKTLQQIADCMLAGTGADISLACLRLDDGTYRIKAFAGDFPVAVKHDLDFKVGQAGTGAAVATSGEPRLVRDYLKEMGDSPHLATSKIVGSRSIICAAAGPAGDVIAVFYVMSRTPNKLGEPDLHRLVTQAEIAEIAIRNELTR